MLVEPVATACIPVGWERRAVRAMGHTISGKALDIGGAGKQRPYLRTKNVFDGFINTDDVLTMPMTDAQFTTFRLNEGDVLLNEGQSIELVGRCAIYRGEYTQPCAMQNQLLRFRAYDHTSSGFASQLFRYCQQSGVFAQIAMQTTSIAHLGLSRFENLVLAVPARVDEQEVIANALDDADAWIESLQQLIEKKRAIVQGAMQELLTSKRRLPGFSGEWQTAGFSDLLKRINVKANQLKSTEYQVSGSFPVVDQGKAHIVAYSDRLDLLLRVPNGGVVVFGDHTCLVKFVSTDFIVGADGTQVLVATAHANAQFMAQLLQYDGIEPTGYNRHFAALTEKTFYVPLSTEQKAIASVLADMDAEIYVLEAKLAKAHYIKEGMMQDLLTGRVRLV